MICFRVQFRNSACSLDVPQEFLAPQVVQTLCQFTTMPGAKLSSEFIALQVCDSLKLFKILQTFSEFSSCFSSCDSKLGVLQEYICARVQVAGYVKPRSSVHSIYLLLGILKRALCVQLDPRRSVKQDEYGPASVL